VLSVSLNCILISLACSNVFWLLLVLFRLVSIGGLLRLLSVMVVVIVGVF
jgi:hypothetical protein